MTDSAIIRANERYKAISGGMSNLGLALLAAAVVKVYSDRTIGLEVGSWLFVAGFLIWLAYKTLGLLESET